jgi:hypothetical protein
LGCNWWSSLTLPSLPCCTLLKRGHHTFVVLIPLELLHIHPPSQIFFVVIDWFSPSNMTKANCQTLRIITFCNSKTITSSCHVFFPLLILLIIVFCSLGIHLGYKKFLCFLSSSLLSFIFGSVFFLFFFFFLKKIIIIIKSKSLHLLVFASFPEASSNEFIHSSHEDNNHSRTVNLMSKQAYSSCRTLLLHGKDSIFMSPLWTIAYVVLELLYISKQFFM